MPKRSGPPPKRSEPAVVGTRKAPIQKRSQERVARILSAASAILAEAGYEGLTMKSVATGAEVPVGTIYQFFATKDDLIAALSRQFSEQVMEFINRRLTPNMLRSDCDAFVATLIDGIGAIQQESSAFVCVFAGSQSDAAFEALAAGLRRSLTQRLDALFKQALPELGAADRRRILEVWTEITRALIGGLDHHMPSERAASMTELRIVLVSYLQARLAAKKPDQAEAAIDRKAAKRKEGPIS